MVEGNDSVLKLEKLNEDAISSEEDFVKNAEQLYDNQIKEVANRIKYREEKIVLISGPSSAGKTTTSYKLQRELKKIGVLSHVLNMDDFFMDQDKIPVREDGFPDIESVHALDINCIKQCLEEILQKGETKTPQFDFALHIRKKEWKDCKLNDNEIIIMEGIHALNPLIIEGLDRDQIFKLYLDCESDFSYKNKIVLTAKELRLLRRIIRDERERSVPVEKTIEMWKEVCKGEEKNIKPFMNTVDYKINTVHFYEPLLYKVVFNESLQQLSHLKVLKPYKKVFKLCGQISDEKIPQDSLIREFIGNAINK